MSRPLTDSEALTAILAGEAGNAGPADPRGLPEPEILLDYLAGRLSPAEEERLGRRLAADPEAARALLDLADLEAAGAEAGTARERPREIGIQAAWRDLEKRLPSAAAPPARRSKALWAMSGIAAALLVTVVGQRVEISNGRKENARLADIVANSESLAVLTTLVLASVRGEEIQEKVLGPGEELRLLIDPEADCPQYAVRIEGPGERDSKTAEGLTTNDQGNLDFHWNASTGDYQVTLSGCEPVRKLEKHRFRIIRRAG